MTAAAQLTNIDATEFSNPMVLHLADLIAARLAAPIEKTITFGELYAQYFERHVKVRLKNSSNAHYFFRCHGDRWRDTMVHKIKRQDVQEWVDTLGLKSRSAATRAFNMLKAVINWGIRRDLIPPINNPCNGVDSFTIAPRERFLSPAELVRIKLSLEEESPLIRDFFWVCLHTGARRGNVLAMRWDEIDFDLQTWTIPDKKYKNGSSHVIPLTAEAITVLRQRRLTSDSPVWVFPGEGLTGHIVEPKRAWKRVAHRAEVFNVRVHDLRRTNGSYLAINGATNFVIAQMLGHKDLRSTAVYARLDLKAVRAAAQRVADNWQQILSSPLVSTNNTATQPVVLMKQEKTFDARRRSSNEPDVQVTESEQAIIEQKILQAISAGASMKKHFHSKIGGKFPRNNPLRSSELHRILLAMQTRGLIVSYKDDNGITRYALC